MEADGVFSGGGIKALGFAGALKAAAEAGYTEWHQVAGTSAGAITAMTLAVGYDADGLKQKLDEFDFAKIADYGGPFGIGRIENLIARDALTHGKVLTKFIEQLLKEAPRPATKFGELGGDLRVIGTDLAHNRMVIFPDDVKLYVNDSGQPLDPDEFPIAEAVRISAGYPYFFPPLKLRDAVTKKEGVLVDGGVVSAYPVFLFDSPQPQHPTWGFQLFSGFGHEKPVYSDISGSGWPIDMLKAILDTSTSALDKLAQQAFGNRSVAIPTGDVSTLDFALTEEQKNFLYDSGYQAAKAFFDSKPTATNTYGVAPP
jgi:NTE family protein